MLAAPRMEAAGCLRTVHNNGGTAFPLRVLYDGPTPGRRSSVGKAQKTTADGRGTGCVGISSPTCTLPLYVAVCQNEHWSGFAINGAKRN